MNEYKNNKYKLHLNNLITFKEKRKMAIRDAKSDWFNQHQTNKFTDLAKFERNNIINTIETIDHLREATSDLLITNSHNNMETTGNNGLISYSWKDSKENEKNSKSTGSLCSNLIQRQINSKPGNSPSNNSNSFNYQNYLQQYQHQMSDSNSTNGTNNNNHNNHSNHNNNSNSNKKINAKLKIVQMRNRNESLGKFRLTIFIDILP